MSIAIKCVDWNAARYDQVYNYELAIKLLLEEIEELFEAKSLVDTLDAIGDITFVAMGVLWKLGCTKEEIHAFFYATDLRILTSYELHDHMNYILEHVIHRAKEDDYGTIPGAYLACSAVFVTCFAKLRSLNMQGCFYAIVDAICESNNTKEVKGKTDAAVKANIVKGASYVPPTQVLLEIAQAYVHVIPERY